MKIIKHGAVNGIPKLTSPGKLVCGDCLKGKQVKASHPVVPIEGQQSGTTKCFELLHMDLMGPIEVASLGGMLRVCHCR